MQKNKFIRATLILMASGMVTKILGMAIRIIYTRIVGDEGVALYSLIMPTYSLLLTFAVLGMPMAISKIVAERKRRSMHILSSAFVIMMVANVIVIAVMVFSSRFVAGYLLRDERVYFLLIICSLTLPFISISSILKGYFFGRQQMVPNAVSNVVEQIVRIILILWLLPIFMERGIEVGVRFLIISNIFSETASIIVFLLFVPRRRKISVRDFKVSAAMSKDLMQISFPSVSGRLIGNIGYFLEPILLTNILLWRGMSRYDITMEYGIYNGYSISMLLMPSFFISAISQSLLPEISHFSSRGEDVMVKRRLKQGIMVSLLVGFVFSVGILVFREQLLRGIYNTSSGSDYIKVLAPVFVLFYLEAPLSSALVALGRVRSSMAISVWGVVIKIGSMCLLAFLGMGIYALVYAEIINILFVVISDIWVLKKTL